VVDLTLSIPIPIPISIPISIAIWRQRWPLIAVRFEIASGAPTLGLAA
jgi:hypothetical protein